MAFPVCAYIDRSICDQNVRLTQVIVVIKCVVSILLSMNILEQCVPMPMIRRVYVLSMYVIPTFHDLSNNTVHVSLKNDPIITLDTCSKE